MSTFFIALGLSLLGALGGLLVASGFFFCVVAALHAVSVPNRAAATRERIRLALSPRLTDLALVALVGIGVVALLRASDLLAFARLHTSAMAMALAIVAASAGLLATAALIADDR